MRLLPAFIVGLLLLYGHTAQAQVLFLVGHVTDAEKNTCLQGATVELLSAKDSIVIETAVVNKRSYIPGIGFMDFKLNAKADSSYIVRFSMLGYHTEYRNVRPGRSGFRQMAPVKMRADVHGLQEVMVKATRIKMLMRGDTIVYDATAFDLNEGAMLDELVRRLPGARLEKGIITINGRRVSSLLIDGRNFFNSNASVALHNLPAYTVDKVKVYDHNGESSRLMGRDMGDKVLTVDVTLKKQYKTGLMANTTLGAATKQRYNGQLYGMLYGKKDNLSLATNLNNLGSNQRPGTGNGLEDLPSNTTGLMSVKAIDINYRHDGKSFDDYVGTSQNLTWRDDDKISRSNSQTFLVGEDFYGKSKGASRSKERNYNGLFFWGWHPHKQIVQASIVVNHIHGQGHAKSKSAQLNSSVGRGESTLDSLFLPNVNARLVQKAVNRVEYQEMGTNSQTHVRLNVSDRIAIGRGDSNYANMVDLTATLMYQNNKARAFSHYKTDYLSGESTTDFRSRYTASPAHKYKYGIRASYGRRLSRKEDKTNLLFVNIEYEFTQDYASAENGLYRLDRLTDYTEDTYLLGMLPSSHEAMLEVLDVSNSYRSRSHIIENSSALSTNYVRRNQERGTSLTIKLNLPLKLRYEKLRYFKERSYERQRHLTAFDPSLKMDWSKKNAKGVFTAGMNYRRTQTAPPLLSLLGLRSDADPLLVTLGNENLKTAYLHTLNLATGHMSMGIYHPCWNANLNFTVSQNAIARFVNLDKTTGITTSRPVNVKGNWTAGGSISFSRGMDKQQKTELNFILGSNYANSVDMNNVAGETSNLHSYVHNLTITATTALSCHVANKIRAILTGSIINQRANSSRADFTYVNVWNYMARLDLKYNLPCNMELSSGLLDYKMSGHNDDSMNTNHLVWNARLLKKLMDGKLTIAVDAYDILSDNSPTTTTINSQGRMETWTNSIPRYVMLHVGYKFTAGRNVKRL